jgi:hypothetical protein
MKDDTTFCVETMAELLYENLKRSEDLSGHLAYCEVTAAIVMRAALIKNLRSFDDELRSKVPKAWRLVDRRRRTVITLLGETAYFRRVYVDGHGSRHYLLDEVLGIAPYQRMEPAAFLWVVKKAADVSYGKAASAFADRSGAYISRMTVMRCVHKEGGLLGFRQAHEGLAISTPVLFCEFDGLWANAQSEAKGQALPRRTYKEQFRKKGMELKVWVAYGGKGRDGRRIHPFHWASDAGPDAFFPECMARTKGAWDTDGIDWLSTGPGAAGWCKAHGLDAEAGGRTQVISRLDAFHVNQKPCKAFASEDDRSKYLGCLYAKDFTGFLTALKARMEQEPDDERAERRREPHAYASSNLDWLDAPSLSCAIRQRLAGGLTAVFGRRSFLPWLLGLLEKRCCKRLAGVLRCIAGRCAEHLRYGYACLLDDAKEAIRLIGPHRPVGLGSMEGTNAKACAARLKVWGCAWSKRGALAMVRIRATLASGQELIAPRHDAWPAAKERARIEAAQALTASQVPESEGGGWQPPQGSISGCTHLDPHLWALVRS